MRHPKCDPDSVCQQSSHWLCAKLIHNSPWVFMCLKSTMQQQNVQLSCPRTWKWSPREQVGVVFDASAAYSSHQWLANRGTATAFFPPMPLCDFSVLCLNLFALLKMIYFTMESCSYYNKNSLSQPGKLLLWNGSCSNDAAWKNNITLQRLPDMVTFCWALSVCVRENCK